MRKALEKKDLRTGDIVVLRNGSIGVVILESNIILYQKDGYDDLDYFSDDLKDITDDDRRFDIMEVYRNSGPIGFLDYKDSDPIFERDDEEETEQGTERIDIITQAFYGNRTHTRIRGDEIDWFIIGDLSPSAADKSNKGVELSRDREIIRIPGTEELVLIYNKSAEAASLQEKTKYDIKPLAEIPEMGLTIYSRCIVCRMNRDGSFESLKPEDCEKFMKYLAR